MDNVVEQFRLAIREAGLKPPDDIEPDGQLRHFSTNGSATDKGGWCVLFDGDVPAGAFGDFRSGVDEKWRGAIGRRLTSQEKAEQKRRFQEARRRRDAKEAERRKAARGEAQAIWKSAKSAPEDHPYLKRKGVKSFGVKVQDDGALVIPVSENGELHSLQFIEPDGFKHFLTDGLTKGCYFPIGKPDGQLYVAEGYATAATIHEVTGHAAVVAFNSGNLLRVAQTMRGKFPDISMTVCGDDDADSPAQGNPGLKAGREATEVTNAFLAVPDFGENKREDESDFNDLFLRDGAEAVRECLRRAEAVTDVVWPTPKPIIAELKTVPAFDADTLLPDALRAWVMDEADRMPCPPDFIAAAAIVALSSIIGARCAIKPKARDSWQIVPNLWGAIVGDPSSKKSPAWSAALKPLDRLIAKAMVSHLEAMGDYETEKMVFDAQEEALRSRIKEAAKKPSKGDPATIARELRDHNEEAPKAPTLRRYKSNDSTWEKLGELLRDNPAGVLMLRDELVGLIASWEREGHEGARTFFLEGWNGDQDFDTDRIGRGNIYIPNLCISIFGGTQPDKLTGYLEQAAHALANDGMLQRFQLLVYPDPCPWEYRDRAPDKVARDVAFAVFEKLADFDPVAWGAAADDLSKFPHYRFDEEAQEIFIEWSSDLHRVRMPNEEEPIIQQHLAKYDKLFPALALILHLVECVETGLRGPVTADAALRAAAWCEYLEGHARRCYGLLKDVGVRGAQALVSKIEKGKIEDGFTLRDVRRKHWRSLTTDGPIQAALDWLEDEDWLRSETTGGTGPGGGRRTVRYQINPSIKVNHK
jgi:phage/plasmid primase-like uncharacterized protein